MKYSLVTTLYLHTIQYSLYNTLVCHNAIEKITLKMSAEKYVMISKILLLINCLNNSVDSNLPKTELKIHFKGIIVAEFGTYLKDLAMLKIYIYFLWQPNSILDSRTSILNILPHVPVV